MTDMRAARFHSYGGPEVLRIERVPVPVPAPGQVLVEVRAVSINGGELLDRSGRLALLGKKDMPRQTGLDFVGTVAALGSGSSAFAVGEKVWGVLPEKDGYTSAAEYTTVPMDRISLAPEKLSAAEAVTLPVGGTTALRALRDEACLQPGERLLVRGASGGVGSLAVQLGAAMGAHVTGLARATSADFVRSLGAARVIDYSVAPRDLPPFDVIMDASTAGGFLAFRKRLAGRGRFVAVAVDFDHPVRDLAAIAFSTVYGRSRVRFFRGAPKTEMLRDLADLAHQGDVRPVVDTVFPLSQIAEAHRRLEAGGVHGKIVVTVD